MNYLDLFQNADHDAINRLLTEKSAWLASGKKGVERFRKPYESVQQIRAQYLDLSGDTVCIGRQDELGEAEHQRLFEVLRTFMPWRKGPFNIFGIGVDAEWRSERKWNRILPVLPDLENKVIADIGCNNGYYMFRMASHRPKMVVGFEPYLQHYFAFQLLNSMAGCTNLAVELLGVEHLHLFSQGFDVVFLLGILYHRSSPVEVLRDIRAAMKPGATLIVESQGIAGELPVALFPEERYAKVPGTYFVPTPSCLQNMVRRAGFEQLEIFFFFFFSSVEESCNEWMVLEYFDYFFLSSLEQRRTEWMVFESFDDFVDPDTGLTVEGYPAPIRIFLKAVNPS